MMIRYILVFLLLGAGHFLQAQSAPATSATDADVKIHKGKRYRRIQGDAHATERQGTAVPKQKIYRTPGSGREGMVKQKSSAKKSKTKARPKRAKKRVTG